MKLNFRWNAGILLRSRIKNQVELFLDAQKSNYNFSYEIKEYKNFLDSDYLLKIEAKNENVLTILRTDLRDYFKKIEDAFGEDE